MDDDFELDPPNRTVLMTTDRTRAYTLSAVEALYIFCCDPVEKFAERYKLPTEAVMKYVQSGKWNELRAQHTERAMEVFKVATIAQVEDSLDIELKLQSLRNIQLEQQAQEYAKYFTKHGHLFMVNKQTGELVYDSNSLPIPIKIPASFTNAHALIQGLESRLKQLAAETTAVKAKPEEKDNTIDLKNYTHFLKPKADV